MHIDIYTYIYIIYMWLYYNIVSLVFHVFPRLEVCTIVLKFLRLLYVFIVFCLFVFVLFIVCCLLFVFVFVSFFWFVLFF
jgi:hypothetical protein